MSNALAIIRSLIIYGLCLPLAIVLGYLLAMPMDLPSLIIVILALCLPLVPVLLRWHHLLLIASWNFAAVLFFLPGRPNLWIVMSLVSLLLSILQHVLNRENKLISVPSVARPLIFLFLVVVVTALLAGGIGVKAFGSQAYGGRRYVLLLAAIVGYFAISCQRVPRGREGLYLSLFLVASISSIIGNFAGYVDPSLNFIFLFFPVQDMMALFGDVPEDISTYRFVGLVPAGSAVVWYCLARHGLGGSFRLSEPWSALPFRLSGGFQITQPWRTVLVLLGVGMGLQAGFRTAAGMFVAMFLCHFFIEGLHRSRALPFLLMTSVLLAAVSVPLASRLPVMVQRAISFLPVEIDPLVRAAADSSTEWRMNIWQAVLPTVPQYLLLGKGYSINPAEMAIIERRSGATGVEAMIATSDYHNGPLTVLVPLGIWGALGFLWFLGASIRVLLRNYRYGDPELRQANTFLLMYFLVKTLFFFFVFGSFQTEFFTFTGLVALSISINGGVRSPMPAVAAPPVVSPFRLARAPRPAPAAG